MMCFLSCEDIDIGDLEADAYCDEYGGRGFICRSTGGGSANRRVCVPGGGGLCTIADDCSPDWPYCCHSVIDEELRCYNSTDAEGLECL